MNEKIFVSIAVCPSELDFRCSNGQCISFIHRCDGSLDCSDESDEKDVVFFNYSLKYNINNKSSLCFEY